MREIKRFLYKVFVKTVLYIRYMMEIAVQAVSTLNVQIRRLLLLKVIARNVLYQNILTLTKKAAKKEYALNGREEDQMELVSSARTTK